MNKIASSDNFLQSLSLGFNNDGYMAMIVFAVILGLILLLALNMFFASQRRKLGAYQAKEQAKIYEVQLQNMLSSQAEMQGRIQTMAEIFGKRQAELNQSIRQQIMGMSNNIGQTLQAQSQTTHENLSKLQERLAVIDSAQNNIQSLAGEMMQLQAILSNKQTRGAFGQGRMEAIIADALPQKSYAFQATLSNGTRPDCLVYMPNNAPSLVIDAKFPLEAWHAMRNAANGEVRQSAEKQFISHIDNHIKDIAKKYLLAGETQDNAFMFVPSESIFATLHEEFDSLIQRANRARVLIVSPSLLMLSIQVVQAIMKDARMREQAHLIQFEVGKLMEDVGRLDDRVRKLQGHFQQSSKDIDDILISTNKVKRHSEKIESFDFNANKTENNSDNKKIAQEDTAPPLQILET